MNHKRDQPTSHNTYLQIGNVNLEIGNAYLQIGKTMPISLTNQITFTRGTPGYTRVSWII